MINKSIPMDLTLKILSYPRDSTIVCQTHYYLILLTKHILCLGSDLARLIESLSSILKALRLILNTA